MSNAKIWTGSSWVTVQALPGPQGPQGPVASADVSPRGAAGGCLEGFYPNPVMKRSVAGTLLDVQQDIPTDTTWFPITSGSPFLRSAGNTLQIYNRQPVDTWWEVEAFVGGLQKDDAAYHYGYLFLNLDNPDMDGLSTRGVIYMQYNGVQTHAWRHVRHIWRCQANIRYTCWMGFTSSGGTWQHNRSPVSTWLAGKTWPQTGVIG